MKLQNFFYYSLRRVYIKLVKNCFMLHIFVESNSIVIFLHYCTKRHRVHILYLCTCIYTIAQCTYNFYPLLTFSICKVFLTLNMHNELILFVFIVNKQLQKILIGQQNDTQKPYVVSTLTFGLFRSDQ